MRNTNSPPSYGQPGQAPPGAQTRPSWAGQQGGPQGMPAGIEQWRQRMAAMPRQQPPPQFSGPAGIGQMASMIAQRFGQRGGQQPGGAQPMPQGPQMPGAGEQMPGGAQPPPMQSQAQAQPRQPQQGMAGLGQAARAMYDKARVNALRGGGKGGGGRAEPGNMQEV